jgi:VWFA-related protein
VRLFGRSKFQILTLPFLVLLLAGVTAAQTKPDESSKAAAPIKVRSELVLIPTEVTDSKGNRVTDLRKEDFAVSENGKRQEIAVFEHKTTKTGMMKQAAVPEGVFTNMVVSNPNRITIFVLDLLNSGFEEQRQARKELIEFLEKSLDVREPLCLIAVDGNGAWMVHDFTTDPVVLSEALKNVKQELPDKERPQKRQEIYKLAQGWNTKSVGENVAAEESRLTMMQMEFGMKDVGLGERIRQTLLALTEIGQAFSGVPGRKSLIWATAGIPFEMGDASAFEKSTAMQNLGDQGIARLYEQTWRTLETANIAVYPLDVSGLANPAYVNAGTGEPLPQHVTSDAHVVNLEQLADMTGGKFCDRSMDGRKCFDLASEDSSDYYVLGFYEQSGTQKPGWRKLNVQSSRPGMRVRARSSYYVGGAEQPLSSAEQMKLALFSPIDFTGLAFELRIAGMTAGSKPGTKSVRFVYTIPGNAVRVDAENGNQVQLEFGAAARDSAGKIVGSLLKEVGGKMTDAQVMEVRAKGIVFTGTMELPAGEYMLNFAIKDSVNENTGSVSAALKVE